MENKTTLDIINEARERVAARLDQERQDEYEKKRFRSHTEAVAKINYWKKEHARKTKTEVRISVVAHYEPEIQRMISYLRLFVGGKLSGDIIPLNEEALDLLTKGIEAETMGSHDYYTIFSNK